MRGLFDGLAPARRLAFGVAISILAAGTAHGAATDARFSSPAGVAVDGSGNVYVADLVNSTIRKIAPNGAVTTLAGAAEQYGSADGTGPSARFNLPSSVAVDGSGNVYVADQGSHTVRRVTPAGVVTTFAGAADQLGSANGTGATARFNGPAGVAVDGSGNVIVADFGNHTIRKIAPGGVVTTLAGTAGAPGITDGTGAAARFNGPTGVAVDGAGNVYVADMLNATVRRITPAGVVTTLAGTAPLTGSADGTGAAARFDNPSGVAVDGSGNLYVADSVNSTIRKVTPAGAVTTFAGTAGQPGTTDGTGAAARFDAPFGVAVDAAGSVYVADYGSHTIRKITSAAVVTTRAGAAGQPGSVDAAPAAPALATWHVLLAGGVAILFLRSASRRTRFPATA